MNKNGKPVILCAGMCNTKGTEIQFLAEQVRAHGGEPLIMDLSLGGSVDFADISNKEIGEAASLDMEEVFAGPRADAIAKIGEAGAQMVLKLREEGRCDGIISWAGSVGSTTVSIVMRALPFGVPKILMTDMASSDVSGWLGNKDIFIVSPTAEQGITAVTSKIVTQACAGIVAMAKVEDPPIERPLAAVTSYGTTTPTQMRITKFFNDNGWDCATFHAVGVGATMEDLIRSGDITAVVDMTPGELTNNMYDSVYGTPKTWRGIRMTAAPDMGIPNVVAPGGLDQCAYGAFETMKEEYVEDFRTGKRKGFRDTGKPYIHNENVTEMVPTIPEIIQLSDFLAEILNGSNGPCAFVIPMRGWSAYDQEAALCTRERGWAEGNGDGPVWEPDEKYPQWSRRATAMLKRMWSKIDPNVVDLIWTDHHILDEEFADLLNTIVWDMIDGEWKIGKYNDFSGKILNNKLTTL
ncbi:hypothetical protein ACU19_09040 [Actinobaculum suis]|uniref:Tm-1-like ATP-binding domain-containing protein n=1 Tax=Actinobaculum suis TaxID=1657 RepID=UPI00066FE87E|nr:Tm-1-like ATP-binding domain-containing protein [Actinobaculum suis]KMY22623.1 hypothetical protein ACU19_09040 [Actinobaculum suis]